MLVCPAPPTLDNTQLVPVRALLTRLLGFGYVQSQRYLTDNAKLIHDGAFVPVHPYFSELQEQDPQLWKHLEGRPQRLREWQKPLEEKPSAWLAQPDYKSLNKRLIDVDRGVSYGSHTQNNLRYYLCNLMYYKSLLIGMDGQFEPTELLSGDVFGERKKGRGSHAETSTLTKGQLYREADYVVQLRMAFVKSMLHLDTYTNGGFEEYEPSFDTEFAYRERKRSKIMRLATGQVNRVVLVKNGGIYTSVGADHKDERTKFHTTDKSRNNPLWSPVSFRNRQLKGEFGDDADLIELRVKESCENFEQKALTKTISTYHGYYTINNKLEARDGRLWFDYEARDDEPASEDGKTEIGIPEYESDRDRWAAPFHVLPDEGAECVWPGELDHHRYEITTPPTGRGAATTDTLGLLYAIRNDTMAVTPPRGNFHSKIWAGKKVQAAGLVVGWNGKIIAIDNMSGHYRPNWYLLSEAVRKLYNDGVFHERALVGFGVDALYRSGSSVFVCQFLPLGRFLRLANDDLPLGPLLGALMDFSERAGRAGRGAKRRADIAKKKLAKKNRVEELENTKANALSPPAPDFLPRDQSRKKDCVDILGAPHFRNYWLPWGDSLVRDRILLAFLQYLEYDLAGVTTKLLEAYAEFRGSKIEKRLAEREKAVRRAITKSLRYASEEDESLHDFQLIMLEEQRIRAESESTRRDFRNLAGALWKGQQAGAKHEEDCRSAQTELDELGKMETELEQKSTELREESSVSRQRKKEIDKELARLEKRAWDTSEDSSDYDEHWADHEAYAKKTAPEIEEIESILGETGQRLQALAKKHWKGTRYRTAAKARKRREWLEDQVDRSERAAGNAKPTPTQHLILAKHAWALIRLNERSKELNVRTNVTVKKWVPPIKRTLYGPGRADAAIESFAEKCLAAFEGQVASREAGYAANADLSLPAS